VSDIFNDLACGAHLLETVVGLASRPGTFLDLVRRVTHAFKLFRHRAGRTLDGPGDALAQRSGLTGIEEGLRRLGASGSDHLLDRVVAALFQNLLPQ
jgi:hypothetical protein